MTGYGFVSRHLIKRLLFEGASVTVVEKNFVPDSALGRDLRFLNMEIRDLTETLDVDYTFHLAAVANPGYAERNPIDAFEANVLGTLNLLRRVRTRRKFLFSSSSNVYGDSKKVLSEHDPIKPINIYGVTKQAAEELIRVIGRKSGLNNAIVRFFTLYGPGAAPMYVIPQICIQALRDRKIIIRDGTVKRDFLFVEDAIDLVVRIAANEDANQVFNVASGRATSIAEIANTVSRIVANGDIEVEDQQLRDPQSPPAQIADISKARGLGWSPTVDLEAGLKATVDYYRKALSFYT